MPPSRGRHSAADEPASTPGLRRIDDILSALVPEGEILVSYQVLLTTRRSVGMGAGSRLHYSMPGQDPAQTVGELILAADRVRAREAGGPISP